MNLADLLKFTARFFDERHVKYFVFGAVAMDFWVPPRSTFDLDVVLCIDKRRIPAIANALNKHGFQMSKALQRKLREGRKIQLKIDKTELDLMLCVSAHDQKAFERAKPFHTDDLTLMVATPEDLILYKLQAWRKLDQADIEKMLSQIEDLDTTYMESWLDPIEQATGYPMRERWLESQKK